MNMRARPPLPPRRRQAGVALIELALVLPLLVTLSVLVVDLGRALHHYHTLTKSLRGAARSLMVLDPATASLKPELIDAVRRQVVYGLPQPAADATALVPGLSLDNVPASNIRWGWSDSTPTYPMVSIRITGYHFEPLLTQVFGLQLGDAQGLIAFAPIAAHMRAAR